MSLFWPLVLLSFSATAAPIPGSPPTSGLNADVGIPVLGSDAHPGSWTPREPTHDSKLSWVSSTDAAGSLSPTGSGLDPELSSTLRGLAMDNLVLDSYLGTWASTSDLPDCLGSDTQSSVILASGLTVQAGEDPEAWVLTEGETSSQTIADLESLSWVLLDDLVCGLTENAFVPTQSILLYQPDGSSNAAVYVSLLDSTLAGLPLDHTLDSFFYADVVGVSSDLGTGNSFDTAIPPPENLALDPYASTSTQVGSETGLSAPCGDLELDTSVAADGTSNLFTSTSSSLALDTDPADGLPVDVGVASVPETSSSSDVSACSCPGK